MALPGSEWVTGCCSLYPGHVGIAGGVSGHLEPCASVVILGIALANLPFGIWGGATALGATVLLLPLGIGLAEMKEDRRSQH